MNPVQLSARNMDAAQQKNSKAPDFWGGGSAPQTTLTFGSIEEIRKEVEELMKIFSPGGGFVFTQIHNIQADISPEKVIEVYKTANRLRDKL